MTPDADDPSPDDDGAPPSSPSISRWAEPPVYAPFEPSSTAADDVEFPAPTTVDVFEQRTEDIATAATPAAPADHLGSDVETTDTSSASLRTIVEWVAVVAAALAIALFIRAYLVQAFEIPSGSMQTTLNIDDRILVNKLSYQVGDVERDNLIVFRKLDGTQSDTDELIKRVVALPGETIEVRDDGLLYVFTDDGFNAIQLDQSYLDPQNSILSAPLASDSPDQNIWHPNCTNPEGNGSRCTLDDSSYYGMGDNRNASTDSRSFGPIPEENLVGRAFARIWPPSAISGL